MDIVGLVIQLIAGAIGGNAVGKISKGFSLGGTGNSIAGAIGGVVLGQEEADDPRELGRQAVVLPDTGLQHADGRRACGT